MAPRWRRRPRRLPSWPHNARDKRRATGWRTRCRKPSMPSKGRSRPTRRPPTWLRFRRWRRRAPWNARWRRRCTGTNCSCSINRSSIATGRAPMASRPWCVGSGTASRCRPRSSFLSPNVRVSFTTSANGCCGGLARTLPPGRCSASPSTSRRCNLPTLISPTATDASCRKPVSTPAASKWRSPRTHC